MNRRPDLINDLVRLAGEGSLRGDDDLDHALEFHEAGDGYTCPNEAWWTCSCEDWTGPSWIQTGHIAPPEDYLDLNPEAVGRAFMHHVYPSVYGDRLDTMTRDRLLPTSPPSPETMIGRTIWSERARERAAAQAPDLADPF